MTIDPRAARAALAKPWLPQDPDIDVEDGGRTVHLHPVYLLYVALGGALGTAAREALSLWFPATAGRVDWTILVVNVLGAFLLGALVEGLALRSGSNGERGRHRTLRLLLGTGLLGGFTTYSTLATGAAELIRAQQPGMAVGYGGLTVTIGLLASYAGIAAAARVAQWVAP